jgi:hypothetical protein
VGKNTTSIFGEITAMADGLENSKRTPGEVFRRYFPLIVILWILFVLYPNPANIIISIHRVLNFEANPGAVESMLNGLPSDAVYIEKAVLASIRYRHDWQVYGMPWYCPTVEQVMERGEGDCKNAEVEFYKYDPESGERQFQIPHIRIGEVMDSFSDTFWDPMPEVRKALLISGLVALVAARVVLRKKKTVRLAVR